MTKSEVLVKLEQIPFQYSMAPLVGVQGYTPQFPPPPGYQQGYTPQSFQPPAYQGMPPPEYHQGYTQMQPQANLPIGNQPPYHNDLSADIFSNHPFQKVAPTNTQSNVCSSILCDFFSCRFARDMLCCHLLLSGSTGCTACESCVQGIGSALEGIFEGIGNGVAGVSEGVGQGLCGCIGEMCQGICSG